MDAIPPSSIIDCTVLNKQHSSAGGMEESGQLGATVWAAPQQQPGLLKHL